MTLKLLSPCRAKVGKPEHSFWDICYAESDDGLHYTKRGRVTWTKPKVTFPLVSGDRGCNVCMCATCRSSRLHHRCLVTQAKPRLTGLELYLQLAFSRRPCPAAPAP